MSDNSPVELGQWRIQVLLMGGHIFFLVTMHELKSPDPGLIVYEKNNS